MNAVIPLAASLAASVCRNVSQLSREELMGAAIARGCSHYRSLLAAPPLAVDLPGLSHEALGCALLTGSPSVGVFQSIRVGAMVLSDLANRPATMAEAADCFGVSHRLAAIARLGLLGDTNPDFWQAVLAALPLLAAGHDQDEAFMPGLSRLTTEKRLPDPSHARARERVWLRTHYLR